MMYFLGVLVYLVGFMGIWYLIEESGIDPFGSFKNTLLTIGWIVLTMFIGKFFIALDDQKNNKDNKDNKDE